jgi:hypothetical protein
MQSPNPVAVDSLASGDGTASGFGLVAPEATRVVGHIGDKSFEAAVEHGIAMFSVSDVPKDLDIDDVVLTAYDHDKLLGTSADHADDGEVK